MTKRHPLFIGLFLIIAAIIFGAGCSNTPNPVDKATAYVKAWNQQDFSAMYKLLTPEAQKEIPEKAFVNRYQTIYKGIEANNLKVTLEKPKKEENPKKITALKLTYHAKMATTAGSLAYSGSIQLNKTPGTKNSPAVWGIQWDPTLILKSLKKGDVVRVTPLKAKRGEIFDRNGVGLAVNGTAAQIGIYPKKWQGDPSEEAQLAALLNISVNAIDQDLQASWVTPDTFVPIKTVSAFDTDIINEATGIPGVMSKDVPARVYPCGKACSHLIGYVGDITAQKLKQEPASSDYTAQSQIGKTGLEALFETKLRARDGAEIQILDRNKQVVSTLAKKDPQNGQNIKLTIDSNVQKTLYSQLKGENGTAAALNPKTGAVLGLVSTPSFDPNQFVMGMTQENYQALVNDPNHPLLNRFTKTYAPGSTLKPLVAAIALHQNVIEPNTTLTINGKKWQKDPSWGNYYITRLDYFKHVKLRDALVFSDNIFFAQTALKLGPEKFIAGLKDFGFTENLPFEYPLVPSQVSNNGAIKNSIQLANSGYGQAQVKVNPLQLAVDFTAFVNQGNVIQPTLLFTPNAKPIYWKKAVVSPDTANVIADDLKQVVNSPQGTAYRPYMPGLSLAGKTGTAEYKTKQGTTGKEDGWFVGYNTNPSNLLISMMIENVQNKGGSHYVVGKVKKAFTALKSQN